jgi:ASC-1-like (ASCH) protein/uncharacterized LabA/DUF88 family protein
MSKKRAIIFIDGNNFYYKMKDITSSQKGILKLLDFKYNEFAKKLIKENLLVEIRYYVGAIRRQKGVNEDKSEKLYSDQQKLLAKLQQQNIPVILGNLIQHPDKSYHEKGVDVRIAVEMIRLARADKYDVAYLLSSDTDLVPAVEEVLSFNKKVVYVSISKGQSFGLTKVSSNTILLREEDIFPFIPSIHIMKLSKTSFDKIKNLQKTIEVRLFDDKRKLLKIGDEIEFTLTSDSSQKIKVKILELAVRDSFERLFSMFEMDMFGFLNQEDVRDVYNYYTRVEEKNYGVIGIRFRTID